MSNNLGPWYFAVCDRTEANSGFYNTPIDAPTNFPARSEAGTLRGAGRVRGRGPCKTRRRCQTQYLQKSLARNIATGTALMMLCLAYHNARAKMCTHYMTTPTYPDSVDLMKDAMILMVYVTQAGTIISTHVRETMG